MLSDQPYSRLILRFKQNGDTETSGCPAAIWLVKVIIVILNILFISYSFFLQNTGLAFGSGDSSCVPCTTQSLPCLLRSITSSLWDSLHSTGLGLPSERKRWTWLMLMGTESRVPGFPHGPSPFLGEKINHLEGKLQRCQTTKKKFPLNVASQHPKTFRPVEEYMLATALGFLWACGLGSTSVVWIHHQDRELHPGTGYCTNSTAGGC